MCTYVHKFIIHIIYMCMCNMTHMNQMCCAYLIHTCDISMCTYMCVYIYMYVHMNKFIRVHMYINTYTYYICVCAT